ncbi:heme biosynthesis HemY N-terminal domain-containing protein [Luteimonas vadosa]|uniref:Heme biosynthesis HemY N-terminal domain-containing protein n=1 Tax=Luteimonas vadosa TaxID=1165507 RepID=A0ABP9DV08_9GAMM
MNLFRNLLIWILLAIIGALAWHLLAQDPGYVLVRYRGTDYTTTVLWAAVGIVAGLLALWLLWTALTLPFRAWRGRKEHQARARLGGGLEALHHGHYARAEKLLAQAAEDDDTAVARIGASQAAMARGRAEDARQHLAALGERAATSRAIATAELALLDGRPTDALVALDAPAAQPLPPRGLALRAEALANSGQSAQAYEMLGALKQQNALTEAQWADNQGRWSAAALREARDANVLADRWEALPKQLKSDPAIVGAYADRAAALRWEEAAAKSIEDALDTRWDEDLAEQYGRLPIGRIDQRRDAAQRWLKAHPASPALLLTLARLERAQGHWPQAEDYLHRALAQGAGAEAWEEFGHGYAAAGDDAHARLCYANALRASRGDAIEPFTDRDLRQTIGDRAVVEERDEHGMPRLRE